MKHKPRKKISKVNSTAAAASWRPHDSGADAPLYQQVLNFLKEEVLSGKYPIGSHLPTEGELTDRFGVSRHTVREALRRLRDDGLITSRQGSGSVVRRSDTEQYVHEVASIDDLIAYATETDYRADSSELVVADAALAERLGGAVGDRWLRIEGYRYCPSRALPICWSEVFVHGAYAGVGLLLGRRRGPIWRWIEDKYGERITEVQQRLRAQIVPGPLAGMLQVDPASTVLEVQRSMRAASGITAEVSCSLYPADRFSFTMTMRRTVR